MMRRASDQQTPSTGTTTLSSSDISSMSMTEIDHHLMCLKHQLRLLEIEKERRLARELISTFIHLLLIPCVSEIILGRWGVYSTQSRLSEKTRNGLMVIFSNLRDTFGCFPDLQDQFQNVALAFWKRGNFTSCETTSIQMMMLHFRPPCHMKPENHPGWAGYHSYCCTKQCTSTKPCCHRFPSVEIEYPRFLESTQHGYFSAQLQLAWCIHSKITGSTLMNALIAFLTCIPPPRLYDVNTTKFTRAMLGESTLKALKASSTSDKIGWKLIRDILKSCWVGSNPMILFLMALDQTGELVNPNDYYWRNGRLFLRKNVNTCFSVEKLAEYCYYMIVSFEKVMLRQGSCETRMFRMSIPWNIFLHEMFLSRPSVSKFATFPKSLRSFLNRAVISGAKKLALADAILVSSTDITECYKLTTRNRWGVPVLKEITNPLSPLREVPYETHMTMSNSGSDDFSFSNMF
jgi:hypothetical protein